MKIVFISLYQVVPPRSGSATVTYNLAKHLPGKKIIIQLGDLDDPGEKPDREFEIRTFHFNSKNKIKKLVFLGGRLREIALIVVRLRPGLIILEGASWAPYYAFLLWLLKTYRTGAPIVYHAHNMEYLLRAQRKNFVVPALTRWAERLIIHKAELSTAVSEVDAELFRRHYGKRPAILPNGVDVERFERISAENLAPIRKRYDLPDRFVLFMGLTTYPPNHQAIGFLFDVFPRIALRHPEAFLAIIGGPVDRRAPWLIAPGNIPYEDVPAFIKSASVAVAPIFSGSGTRVKILEYMAAGTPVVATAKGAEGLDVRNGENIVLAENAGEFAERLGFLLEDKAAAARIGRAGQDLVRRSYQYREIVRRFVEDHLSAIAPQIGKENVPNPAESIGEDIPARRCPMD